MQCETFTLEGPQPATITNVQHEPMLNVLGVLRPDSINSLSQSSIHLENAFSIDDINRYNIIVDAFVYIHQLNSDTVFHTYFLKYSNLDYKK